MADHEFYGTVSAQSATESDQLTRLDQLQAQIAYAINRANHTNTQGTETIDGLADFVNNLIQNVVGAAPDALNTLQEIADALGNDENFAGTITTQLGGLDSRVTQLESAVGGGVGSYKQDIGDGTASTYTVTHNLGGDVRVEVVRLADGQTVHPVIKRPGMSTTAVSIDFGSFVPANASHRVLVSKVG
jgi:uncharacterized phage infection (PIP) family protein YhgE